MDKQSFVNYIKTLELNEKIEGAVLKYVEQNEYGDEMVENVAKILETAADTAVVSSEQINLIIEKMKKLEEGLEDSADKMDALGEESGMKYMEEMTKILDEEGKALKPAEISASNPVTETPQTAVVQPAESTAPVSPTAPEQTAPPQPEVNVAQPNTAPAETFQQ